MKSYRVREKLNDNLLDQLLLARGVTPEQFNTFLEPDFVRDSHDPFLLPGMAAAVERIISAQKNNECVCVWSDYDCDGIPGGVLLVDFFRTMGLDVIHYIPHRHKEGYGLNNEGIAGLAAQKVSLIVTVDLGTTDVEPIAFAKSKSIDVIITDHHLEPAVLPDALAIINPKLSSSKYPFDGLCGAGVAWKLVQGILAKNRPGGFAEGQEKWLLDLVALGTLSDMVPLLDENRMLARFGLVVMRRGRRPGLAALLKLLRISPYTLTEDDIGFMVAPRINAASRMDTPQTAARLLGADAFEAPALAQELNKVNDERKGIVAATVKEANKRLKESVESPVIVMGSPKWRPGILGLVANKLVESQGKPVCLWGMEGGDIIRGSCRSDSVNVVDLLANAGDVFEDFGGHTGSGGFSLTRERVHELPERLSAAYEKLVAQASASDEVTVDRELSLSELPHALKVLKQVAPFGIGNSKPLFIFPGVSIVSSRTFGKASDHLELTLSHGTSSVSGISFFSTPNSYTKKYSMGDRADIVGNVELDWRGLPRVRVVDVI